MGTRARLTTGRRVGGALIVVGAGLWGLAGTLPVPPAGASGPSAWGTPVEATGGGSLYEVSCQDPGTCTAVGQDGNDEPMVDDETGATWASPTEIPVTGTGEFSGELTGVSCTSAGNCTAIGVVDASQGLTVSETGGSWGALGGLTVAHGGYLSGISCSAPGDCTAVGYDNTPQPVTVTETDGTWGTVTEDPLTAGGYLARVSCTAPGDCTAVGNDLDDQPLVATSTGGIWSTPVEVSGYADATFNSVSCTSATDCTAVGYSYSPIEPVYATEVDGTWTATASPTGDGLGTFVDVDCGSPGNCTAAGYTVVDAEPMSATETAGTWGPVSVDTVTGGGWFTGLSCTAPGVCTAVGTDQRSGSNPIIATSTTAPDPPTAVRVTVGDTRVTVGWAAPVNDGGTPVTGYTADAYPAADCTTACTGSPAATASAGSTATSIPVTGLTDGTAYDITVSATNGDGSGPPSAPLGPEVPVAPPTVTSASPAIVAQGASGTVVVTGTGFVAGSKVSISGPGVAAGKATVTGPTALSTKLTAQATAALGPRAVTVRDGSGTGSCTGCLMVIAAPTLTGISPATAAPSTKVRVQLTGSGFAAGCKVTGPPGVAFTHVKVISQTTLSATMTVSSATAAGTGLTVTVADDSTGGFGRASAALLAIT